MPGVKLTQRTIEASTNNPIHQRRRKGGSHIAVDIIPEGKDWKGDWDSPAQGLSANNLMSNIPPLYSLNYVIRMIQHSQ